MSLGDSNEDGRLVRGGLVLQWECQGIALDYVLEAYEVEDYFGCDRCCWDDEYDRAYDWEIGCLNGLIDRILVGLNRVKKARKVGK